MIVDCHTHIWSSPAQLGSSASDYLRRQSGDEKLCADPSDHAMAARHVHKTLVLGFGSTASATGVPNEFIANYVSRQSGGNMIGIASADPTAPDMLEAAEAVLQDKSFRGFTVSPASQNFHPADSRAMKFYEFAASRGTPVFFCQDSHFLPQDHLEYARPILLDEIAREFPTLTIIIASMGQPWFNETIALLGKHPRVYSDIAALVRRPWQLYNALVLAHQYNVMDKLLFGSDFPYFTADEAIQSIYRLHEMSKGTNLPTIPREVLRSMVERDALTALGIVRPGEAAPAAPAEDEEFRM